MNPEQLALLRGIKTSLLHLMATGPLEVLQPVTDAYLAVRRAEAAIPLKGTSLPTPPMHAVTLEMADAKVGFPVPPEVLPWETAP